MPPISPPYQNMTALAAPARLRAEVWRTALGLLLAAVFTVLIVVAVTIPVAVLVGGDAARRIMTAAFSANTAPGVIGLLFSFLPIMLGMGFSVLVLMRRNPLRLFGPLIPFLRNFVRIGVPLMALGLLIMPLTITGDDVAPHLTLAQLAPWLPAALIGLLVQTATEEVIFRGYLQQQLAARFASRWVWLAVPSLLFGLAHYSGATPLPITLMTMLWAGCFGLAAADLTARTGNLGAGLALHFTNNVSAILLVGFAGPLGGLSLYSVTPSGDAAVLIYFAQDSVSLLVAWLIARLILRR